MRAIGLLLLLSIAVAGQELKRPRITGVAHIAIFSADIEASRKFYSGLLGYEEAYKLTEPDGKLRLTFIKINDRQFIEMFPEKEPKSDRLNHIALEVEDIEAMRAYLAAKGFQVPAKVPKGRTGNLNFTIKDPDGHGVEFVQYLPDSDSGKTRGKHMGAGLSNRLAHVGILVGSLDKSNAFYRDLLGFRETWRGSRDEKVLSWVNMQAPDSDDYVEFMLYEQLPEPTRRGSAHHLCLFVPDVERSKNWLAGRTAAAGYTRALEVRTGINRRRQLNLFDPDGTRTELMEPHTVDGKPAPSSPAAAPR